MTSVFQVSPFPTATNQIYVFDPKYKCDKKTHHHTEILSWVKETCKGGWQVKWDWGGRPEVWLNDHADYMLYLLKWS